MATEQPRPSRHGEIGAILDAKTGGVREVRDEADKYTVVGAAERRTFANWLTPIEEHFVCHRNDVPEADEEDWTVAPSGDAEGTLSMTELREDYPTRRRPHDGVCGANAVTVEVGPVDGG